MDFMNKRHIINFLSFLMSFHLFAQKSSEQALKIIEKIDKNMFAKTQVVTSEMVVYGKRKKRIIKSRGYSKGVENNYTEYLFPEREKGTKMLKLGNKLWQITGLENQASYFIVKDDFNKAAFPYWKFKSKESLLKNLKELIDQKKAGQSFIFGLLLAIALLAIFDTQILSIFRRQKEIGTYIALGMTRLKVVRLFTVEGSVYSILALLIGSIYGVPFFIYMAKAGFPIPPADQKMGIALADVIYPVYGLKLIFSTILTVIISATIVSYLPARKIAKLNPVLALKGKKQ